MHLKDTFAALWSRALSRKLSAASSGWECSSIVNTHTHTHSDLYRVYIGVDIWALICINSFRLQPETGLIMRLCPARRDRETEREGESISGPGANIYWPPLIYERAVGAPHSLRPKLVASGKAVVANCPQAALPAVTKERNMCGKLTD